MTLDSILNDLYAAPEQQSLTKTAEHTMHAALLAGGQTATVSENAYADMSTADLARLALELEAAEKTASAQTPPAPPQNDEALLQQIAMDTIGGQVMAHATVHEFRLIKEAMAQGLCRICKSNALDTQGSSICSACLAS